MLQALPVTPTCELAATGEPVFWVQLMLALFVPGLGAVNGLVAVAVTVTEPLALAATLPIVQLTVPLMLLQPPVQLLNAKPAGSVSVMVTPVAVAVP